MKDKNKNIGKILHDFMLRKSILKQYPKGRIITEIEKLDLIKHKDC